MNSCKYCGKTRREHDFSGLCKDHEHFYDNGEEDIEELKERRERIATAALNGLLANRNTLLNSQSLSSDSKLLADICVLFADELIAALDLGKIQEVKP